VQQRRLPYTRQPPQHNCGHNITHIGSRRGECESNTRAYGSATRATEHKSACGKRHGRGGNADGYRADRSRAGAVRPEPGGAAGEGGQRIDSQATDKEE